MDLYTTSFSFPRPTPHALRPSSSPLPSSNLPLPTPGSGSLPTVPLPNPNVTSATSPSKKSNASAPLTTARQVELDWEAVQKTCIDITTREACLVTVSKEGAGVDLGSAPPTSGVTDNGTDAVLPDTTVWNFHLSGGYQSVMAARGAILREIPRDNRTTLRVPRTDMLEKPLASVSPLKADVKRRLDEIASETLAKIEVINLEIPGGGGFGGTVLATSDGMGGPVSEATAADAGEGKQEGGGAPRKGSAGGSTGAGSTGGSLNGGGEGSKNPSPTKSQGTAGEAGTGNAPVTYGLETERMCELVITGRIESVELAKVRLLVMLDELSGLHSEVCDIDYKLHNIIASRKRCVVQSIQEETATNIYFPTPLVGVLNAPAPGSHQGLGYRNMGMGPMGGMQHTGVGMQMPPPGGMHGMGLNGMPGGGGGGGVGMNGFPSQQHPSHHHSPMPPPHHQHHPRAQPPAYNPHQHVHYPYQPQPMDINPQTTRGLPYSGPGMQHYAPSPMPMSVNHTGMSTVSQMPNTGFHPHHRSPMPMNLSPQPGMPMMGGFPGGQNGQGHMHVGMGGPGMMGHHQQQHPHHHQQQQHHQQQPHHAMGGGMGMAGPGLGPGMGGAGGFGAGPHPGLSVHGGEQGALGKANQIWITGEFFGVQRARDMLLNVAVQKSKLVISRDTAILPRKLDWLLTERIEDVKNIMNDNGTYIQVPSVGSQASLITVFGDHRVNIERTIRSIMALACQFYVASFWLLPIAFDVLMPQASLNPAQMQPILKQIAHATGAEVVFKSNCFEMHGLEQEVRAAVMMVLELDVIHSFHHEIRFQIELANEHRDFISGKKNGKINKIMKMAGVKIKFETFNDYNFLMDVSGSDIGSLQGLSMLQEELPAEVSFHVPESYHKRIIGVGGKNIQRIMKLYGVYVKFSNAEEFAQLGGYLDNEDNVVARTPAKNAINLESLKQSVMEMVNPKDKDYTVESVSIPRRYHRTLLGEKSIFIHDIEHKTNSIVRFPYKESASDIVTIFGPESQVHIAAAMLLDHVPFEADLHVPPNTELTRLVTSPEFILFTERVKRDHQIAIVPSAKFGQGDEAIFKFRCQRSNIDFLGTARDSLEEYLGQHNIQVYPSAAHKRADTYMDAFSHFNSKLLSTAGKAQAGEPAEGESLVERRQRPATVSTDVKALFDGGGGGQGFNNGGTGFAGPLSFHDPRREYWQGGPAQTNPAPTQHEPSKRDSDPIIQDKVRQASTGHHPLGHQARAVSARTQSLDITSLNFSRSLSGGGSGAFGPMPPSPGGPNQNSPNTATGQFFPSHTGGGLRANITGRGAGVYDGGVEGVTQGLSNVTVSHQ